MRVGIDYRPVTAAPHSGISRQVLAMEAALAELGHEPVRLTMAPAAHPHRQSCHCPDVEVAPARLHRPEQRLRFEAGFLPRQLPRLQLDLYIATANSGLPLLRRPRLRLVTLVHDLFQLTLPGAHASALRAAVYRNLDRYLVGHAVRTADRLWTPSAYSAGELAKLFPASAQRVRVLHNAVVPLPPPSALPEGLAPGYWLAVGSREPRKNLPLLLQRWRALRNQGHGLPPLVVVGSPLDVPSELAKSNGLHWLSGIDDATLAAVYRGAGRLFHPAWAEGFGLPVIEAMAQGTPVAAATGSALDEILPDCAPRFDPYSPNALDVALLCACSGRQPGETVENLQAAAARFDAQVYRARLTELLAEACR